LPKVATATVSVPSGRGADSDAATRAETETVTIHVVIQSPRLKAFLLVPALGRSGATRRIGLAWSGAVGVLSRPRKGCVLIAPLLVNTWGALEAWPE
jgi:hypothetical protein